MYIGKIETGRSYKKIIFLFVILSIILIGFVVYNSFSGAEIILSPKKNIEKVDFEIPVGQVEENESLSNYFLPGRLIVKISDEKQSFSDIDLKTVDDHASGKVIFYNKRGESQSLVARTQLRSEKTGLIFRTKQRVVVPAHGEAEVDVVADDVGVKTNIEPDRLTVLKIWKDWQNLIYAENKEKFAGGTREAKVASEDQIEKARQAVAQNIHQKNIDSIRSELNEEEKILDNAVSKEILTHKAFTRTDKQTEQFDMYAQVKSVAVIFNEESLNDLAQNKLKAQIIEGKEFLGHNPNSFKYNVQSYDEKNSTARIKTYLEGSSIYKISSAAFDKEKLIGRNKDEIESYFKNNADVENIKISFFPFWVNSVPNMKDHIDILVAK